MLDLCLILRFCLCDAHSGGKIFIECIVKYSLGVGIFYERLVGEMPSSDARLLTPKRVWEPPRLTLSQGADTFRRHQFGPLRHWMPVLLLLALLHVVRVGTKPCYNHREGRSGDPMLQTSGRTLDTLQVLR